MKKYTFNSLYLIVLALCASLSTLAACDNAKEELTVTRAERDELKSQLASLQAAVHAAQKDFEAAKEQAARCQPAATDDAPTTPTMVTDASRPAPAGSGGKRLAAKK